MAEETKKATGSGSVDDGKSMAALAYVIFFIPLLMNPRNDFATYHAKQGLVLLIASIVGSVLLTVLSVVTFGLGVILYPIYWLAILALAVIGIMNALNGKEEQLPVIGQFASNFKF